MRIHERAAVLSWLAVMCVAPAAAAQYRAEALSQRAVDWQPVPAAPLAITCPGRRVATVLLSTAAGAASGWFFFTFGIGLLASDHGDVYQAERRKYVAAGALVGAGIGVYRAVVSDCHDLPTRRRPSRRPDADASSRSWLQTPDSDQSPLVAPRNGKRGNGLPAVGQNPTSAVPETR